MDHRNIRVLSGDQVTFIVTQTNSNLFLLYLKRVRNFFKE